jgi:predicted nuclease with TOPRIM domain
MMDDLKLIELAKVHGLDVEDDQWDDIVEFGFSVEKHARENCDNMVAELEREIRMVRARVKRLEEENAWLEEENVRLMQQTRT